MLMKLAVLVVLGVVLANSCSAMPRKALMEEGEIRSGQAQADQAGGSLDSSDANLSNHHYIPRDQYKNYVNSPYVPGTDAEVGSNG